MQHIRVYCNVFEETFGRRSFDLSLQYDAMRYDNINAAVADLMELLPNVLFSFRFFKKGSCQLLAKVCARSTG